MMSFRVNGGRYPLRTLGLQRTSSMEEYCRLFVDFLWTFKDTGRSGSYLRHDINGSGQRGFPQISGCILDVPKLLHSVVQHEGE